MEDATSRIRRRQSEIECKFSPEDSPPPFSLVREEEHRGTVQVQKSSTARVTAANHLTVSRGPARAPQACCGKDVEELDPEQGSVTPFVDVTPRTATRCGRHTLKRGSQRRCHPHLIDPLRAGSPPWRLSYAQHADTSATRLLLKSGQENAWISHSTTGSCPRLISPGEIQERRGLVKPCRYHPCSCTCFGPRRTPTAAGWKKEVGGLVRLGD